LGFKSREEDMKKAKLLDYLERLEVDDVVADFFMHLPESKEFEQKDLFLAVMTVKTEVAKINAILTKMEMQGILVRIGQSKFKLKL